MIEIRGAYNTALCYCSVLDGTAEAQVKTLCDQEEFAGCKIRIMPDVHAGMGCTIGTTMTIRDKIVPGMVGVDIGCGMETVLLADKRVDLQQFDKISFYRFGERSIHENMIFALLPTDTMSIFFFDPDTLAKYDWSIIREEYKILVRYDLSHDNLRELKWCVCYPPTEAMQNMKMYPPYATF